MLSVILKNQVDATVETQSEYAESRVTLPRLKRVCVTQCEAQLGFLSGARTMLTLTLGNWFRRTDSFRMLITFRL